MFWYPEEQDYDVTDSQGVTLRVFLQQYDPSRYERPAVTVDTLVFKKTGGDLQILLIRRGRHPYFGMLGLPGGFIEMHEPLEEAAARELREETGVTGIPLAQLGAYGCVGRDPRLRIISVAYYCVITNDITCIAGDDAADAGFFKVENRKKQSGPDIVHTLLFRSKTVETQCEILERAGKRTIKRSGLSADHALMVLDALERLGQSDNK